MNSTKTVLISTIQPAGGGVPAMVRAVVDYLRQRDYQITLAYYEPYSVSPECSVPLPRLLTRRPSTKRSEYYGCRCVGVGCYLPELEFTHYAASQPWKTLIQQHDFCLAVSGSSLAALPFVQTDTPFMAWIASDWQGDREHRVKTFPWYRRLLDQTLIAFVTKRLEKKIVKSKKLLALSEHTRAMLNQRVGGLPVEHVLPMSIDTESLQPKLATSSRQSIGFVGRFEDPRKNIGLLISSFAKLVNKLPQLDLVLIGDQLSESNVKLAEQLGVLDRIVVHSYLDGDKLLDSIRSLDLFVLPSFQEGLCIAALEAMSCGVPVVSTRCGGPETYIKNAENGLLVDSDPSAMSNAIFKLLSDDSLRLSYAKKARESVIQNFSKQALATEFWRYFDKYLASQ